MDLTLDCNIELFPIHKDQNFALALASSLARGGSSGGNADGSAEDERDVWRPDRKGGRGLEDDYDYVMYGKIYKFDGGVGEIVTAYISFGGLLMSLTGSFRHMTSIVLGDPVYLLMRKWNYGCYSIILIISITVSYKTKVSGYLRLFRFFCCLLQLLGGRIILATQPSTLHVQQGRVAPGVGWVREVLAH